MKFQLANSELELRKKRILLGLVFSIALAGIITYQHLRYPKDYNDVLFWSVVGFVVLANMLNYYRHRRYLKLAKSHSIELLDGLLRFTTGDGISELSLQDVTSMRVFQRRKQLSHIQLQLGNGRGIRLEGYDNMPALAEGLREQLPNKGLL